MLDTRDPDDTLIMNLADAVIPPVGHYDLRREIGRGGMSVVYEAQDTRTGQEVALKLLTPPPALTSEDAGNLVARFEREARTAARLSHPNVIRIYEIGVCQGRHFLAMEYLRGQTLRERLREGALTLRDAYPILTQIAGGLDAVHKAGIVHRDIKPANIMLLPDGTAKLLDFGIARSSQETEITHAGLLVGSPSYMAPEQIKGEPGTAATDLWALGVVCYEMFAGYLPFTSQTVGSVLYQIMHQDPVPTPKLPTAGQKVLRRALEKTPAQRYPSASALVKALKSAFTESASTEQGAAAPASPPRSDPRSIPSWLPGAALGLLFLLGFCGAALVRHRVSEAVPTESARPIPAQLPAQISSQIPARRTVSPRLFQASLPDAPPLLHSAAVAAVPPEPRTAPAPLRHQAAPRQAPILPPPLKFPADPAKAAAAEPTIRRVAQTAVSSPVRLRRPVVALNPSADHRVRVQTANRPVPVQAAVSRIPAQPVPPEVPVPSINRPVPVQSTAQDSTLPADGSGDDPEADARQRKFAWSQNGSASTP